MALVNSFTDVRTIASIGIAATTVFAHGLPAAPDYVSIEAVDITTAGLWAVTFDATNVTVLQRGAAATPALRVVSIVAHSVPR